MSNAGGSSSWAINVDKCVTTVGESGPGGSSSDSWKYMSCIYKIPDHIAGANPKLYQPQMVSLGPYNHQLKFEDKDLSAMELEKHSALGRFERRSKTNILVYHEILRQQLEYLVYPYQPRDFMINRFVDEPGYLKFTKLMIRDGCFILEILHLGTSKSIEDNDDHTLFSRHGNTYLVPLIKQDMLLLENQVPFWLLEFLLSSTELIPTERNYLITKSEISLSDKCSFYQTGFSDKLLKLIIKFYSLPESTSTIKPPYLHILDIYRRGLFSQSFRRNKIRMRHLIDAIDCKDDRTVLNFPSASKLYEAGIPFTRSQTANLKDISYHRGTLRLPPIDITKDTVSTLANLMAFEKLHISAGNEIISYVYVLNCLIHSARDVSLLESREIIQHTLRDEEDVVKSFGLIGKDVVAPPDNLLVELYIVIHQLRRRRFRKRLNIWRIDLLQKYFNTPWGALSVIAAILLFTLTIIQTVYTVLSYVNRK